jgi:hypothetical protein
MKAIFLDHDGVICLSNNWGTHHKKQKLWGGRTFITKTNEIPIEYRFDNFDTKAVKTLNEILRITDAEIVVSSDWRLHATVEELGQYYELQGVIKKPIGITKTLAECNTPKDFIWSRQWDLEQTRSFEIHQYLKEHSSITSWVAIDDLDMGKAGKYYSMEFTHDWGLENFVHTPRSNEGIKQSGVKEKILKFLK